MMIMIWLIVFVFICGQIEQFNCASDSAGIYSDEEPEYDDDPYCYELTPSISVGSELISPLINDSIDALLRSKIADNQTGIPFRLIIRLVNARTSKPLVGAYIYVRHVNALGNYSSENGKRRFERFAPWENEPFEEKFKEFQIPPPFEPEFDHQPDHGNPFEPHLRQDHENHRPLPPPDKWTGFESDEAFNRFDGPRSRDPFKPPSEFYGSPFNEFNNNFDKFYGNDSILDSERLVNSSDSFVVAAPNPNSSVNSNDQVHGQKHYANETQRHFLQGYQITDFKGDVAFITIIPGWIFNRSLHVNVSVYLDKSQENATFVGQLYFPNELADRLKSVPIYSQTNPPNLTKNNEDKIFKANNGSSTILTLETIGSGYQSIITLGIDPLKTIKT